MLPSIWRQDSVRSRFIHVSGCFIKELGDVALAAAGAAEMEDGGKHLLHSSSATLNHKWSLD